MPIIRTLHSLFFLTASALLALAAAGCTGEAQHGQSQLVVAEKPASTSADREQANHEPSQAASSKSATTAPAVVGQPADVALPTSNQLIPAVALETAEPGDKPQTQIAQVQFKSPDDAEGRTAEEHDEDSYEQRRKQIDFVKTNGEIFVNWEKPRLALFFSGMMDGYIEPCGCAGLENQKGGLSRRHTLIRELEAKGWNIVPLDTGGMVRRLGDQATIKYQRGIDALQTIGYKAVGLGQRDLMLPTEGLLATLPQDGPTPFVSANVSSIFDEEFAFRVPYRVIEAAGVRIGVTQILGSDRCKKVQNPDFEFVEPAQALPAVLEKLKAERCHQLILLANSSLDEARQLARQFSDFHYVVAAGESDPPADRAEPIEGTRTRLIELSHKGMYVGVLAYFDKPKPMARYQRIPLDGRFEDSDAMLAMMAAYQSELKELGFTRLGARPSPHPQGRRYVGSETCGECHTTVYDIWKKTPHAHATASLIDLPTPRHFDPECVSCHVTGWEPQEYYPFVTGYLGLKETPHLRTNGCENCHGAGHDHVAAENGDVDLDDEQIEALRASMRLTKEEAKRNDCYRCHDLDNSPDFDFDKYWPDVEHKGKD